MCLKVITILYLYLLYLTITLTQLQFVLMSNSIAVVFEIQNISITVCLFGSVTFMDYLISK